MSSQPARTGAGSATGSTENVMTLFAVLWGAASIFHVVGPSGQIFGALLQPTPIGLSQVLLCLASLWLIAQPRKNGPLLLVGALGLITLWFEAPGLGNHWLLAGFVNLGLIVAALLARSRGRLERQQLGECFLPVARMCLIAFYLFAAFAKLNPAFFDTTVSCSTFFFDETARSYGVEGPITVGAGGLATLIPIGTVITELSIPFLLMGRRTRIFGVLLGLMFHSVIALDRIHPFIDFSAVLAALFTLFLAPGFSEQALDFLHGRGKALFGTLMGLSAVLFVVVWPGNSWFSYGVLVQGRMLLWYLFDAALLAGTLLWAWRNRQAPALEQPFVLPDKGRIVLKLVPALLIVNGLLVYLELRTAFSYTMYSNLRMVDGESNHFIVRDSLPVGNRLSGLVSVIDTNDPGLASYVGARFEIPWDSFRAYLSRHPDVSVTYERDGKRHVLAHASDDPELVDPPSVLVQKLLALRAVDPSDPPRCQDVFLPAL